MMIRGLQKQMIQVSTPKSTYFEVVCFVLRPELSRESIKDADMLREAHRILAQSEPTKTGKEAKGKEKRPISFFFLGLSCGSLATAIISLLLAILF